jgi:isoleucyl-tRNA synthetase
MPEIAKEVGRRDAAELVQALRANGAVSLNVAGTAVTLTNEDLEARIEGKPGFAVEIDHDRYVVLDINLTPELIAEGLAREVVSKVQNMRKTADFELTDRITLALAAEPSVLDAVGQFAEYIKAETLAVGIKTTGQPDETYVTWDINGHSVKLKVSKM